MLTKVRSRSLTHIDQIEQSTKPGAIFLKEMSQERRREQQLKVPTERGRSNRPMLSRSEASSSECFTVGFEGASDGHADEFVPASKNSTLRNVLTELCKRRGVDLTNSNVFLDANRSPLPSLDIDTSWMAGKHIRVKVNDRVTAFKRADATKNSFGSSAPLKKISSTYRSNKSGSRTHNVSSEEHSLAEPGTSAKSTKRWSGFFGTSRDTTRMETLVDLLDSYTKNGIYEYEDTYNLESDWKMIVTEARDLEERQSQQQEAIWELLRSEIDYIKMLRVVCHLFMACLKNLQSNQLLLEIDNKKLFGNVEEVFACNDAFWKRFMMPVVESSRKSGDLLNPELLRDGFHGFPSLFKCYEAYCSQQSRCQRYCRERLQQDQDNELFTAYLAWCETQKECNRLKLLDILVKPMQRLTKYSLLLKAILKHTSNPGHRDSLIAMIRNVDLFVNQVNTTLKQNQDLETMKQLMSKIESYDVVETKDDDLSNLVQKYCNLNLACDIPGTNHKRSILYESDVKFKDVMTSSKIEVHVFLLTDMLLVTKAVKRLGEFKVKFKIIRQPFVIDRLVTHEVARDPPTLACVYLSMHQTACSAFVLSCSEIDLIKNWSEAIKRAKALYASLKTNATLQPPTTLPISRQQSGGLDEDAAAGDPVEESKATSYNLSLWAGRSPRGSSRGSRMSSLVHSHSGSMEMTENISSMSSVSASRGVSVENNSELRGSSLSSDDGNANLTASPRLELTTTTSPRSEKRDASPHPERRDSPVSPRPESKSLYRKANTKSENTLTIHVPHLGQSLPNLNIASSPGGINQNPSPPNTLLLAPPKSHGGFLSPGQRGISYPPPSPPRGSLRRAFAIAPRNPPLVKTGHISTEVFRSLSVAQTVAEAPEKAPEKSGRTVAVQARAAMRDASAQTGPEAWKCCSCCRGKRLTRSDQRSSPAEDAKEGGTQGGSRRDPAPASGARGSSGVGSATSGIDGLSSGGFRFDEVLQLVGLEESRRPETDLELFDRKVSRWQRYGFREECSGAATTGRAESLRAWTLAPRAEPPRHAPPNSAFRNLRWKQLEHSSDFDRFMPMSVKALHLERIQVARENSRKARAKKRGERRSSM